MLKRRGFTLVELLVGIVMLGIVGLVSARLLMSMMRVTTAQVQIAGAQGTARTGMMVVPQEFREIGYDTIPTGNTSSDLIDIAANRITFRAMRGMGMTCAVTATPTEIDAVWIREPIFGMREPTIQDSVLMFVENEKNRGDDDQWVPVDVSAVDNGTCGADKAIKLTFATPPKHYLPSFDNILGSQWQLGGPVRWYERMEYGPVIDATTGRTYVGARSENLGQNTLLPMIGPISDSSGFALTYYDASGTALTPATAQKIDVRSIGISLTGTTTAPLSLSGSSNRARSNVPVFTRVALRNILRP